MYGGTSNSMSSCLSDHNDSKNVQFDISAMFRYGVMGRNRGQKVETAPRVRYLVKFVISGIPGVIRNI